MNKPTKSQKTGEFSQKIFETIITPSIYKKKPSAMIILNDLTHLN
jgi:hypothetical protein